MHVQATTVLKLQEEVNLGILSSIRGQRTKKHESKGQVKSYETKKSPIPPSGNLKCPHVSAGIGNLPCFTTI